jgi:hypothetical protein
MGGNTKNISVKSKSNVSIRNECIYFYHYI